MAGVPGMDANTGMMALQQMRAGQPEAMARRLNSPNQANTSDAAARKTANEFEAMFLSQMLEHMTTGIKTDGPFGGGQGEEMFRSLLNQQYAEMLTKSGGIGIADHVYRQILALQEV
ncbi:MAG: rod-binding protein [Alphaproteobacteria bacterium]